MTRLELENGHTKSLNWNWNRKTGKLENWKVERGSGKLELKLETAPGEWSSEIPELELEQENWKTGKRKADLENWN